MWVYEEKAPAGRRCASTRLEDQIFTYNCICHSSDCLPKRSSAILHVMALLAPIELSGAEKLEILQRLDRYRKWRALDEKRYCLACGQIIEGRDILVVGGTRGTGPLRLTCSTRNCHSIPMDWVIPSDEVLARMSMLQDEEPLPPKAANRSREKFTARLRRFATQFRPAA